MKLEFIGDTQDLMKGIEILSQEFDFAIRKGGIPIQVQRSDGKLEVLMNQGKGDDKIQEKDPLLSRIGNTY